MTVESETDSVTYTGNDATTSWNFDFIVLSEDDLVVKVINTLTQEIVTLTSSQYEVEGTLPGTGSITYPLDDDPLDSDHRIVVSRMVDYTQELDINTQSGFDPTTVEQQLDKIVMMIQQIASTGSRTIQLPVGDNETDLVLPYDVDRAGKYLAFDENGALSLIGTAPSVQYQGAFSTANAPTTRLNGDALQEGDLYFDTTLSRLRVYTSSVWTTAVDASSSIDINGMAALGAALASGDFVPIYDLSETANRKATPQQLLNYFDTLAAETAIATADKLVIYDASDAAAETITPENFLKILNSLTEDASPDVDNDLLLSYDASANTVKKVKITNALSVAGGSYTQTAAATLSGSTTGITGLPSDISVIYVAIEGASLDGSGTIELRIGTSSSYSTTGYLSTVFQQGGDDSSTSSIILTRSISSTVNCSGVIIGVKVSGNIWVFSGNLAGSTSSFSTAGRKELTGALERIQLRGGGGSSFDAGTFSVGYI